AMSAMRWATKSSNPIAPCALRTQAANGPPPGTIMSGPPHFASMSSQAAHGGVNARLPPSLTTVSFDSGALSAITKEERHDLARRSQFRPAFAFDLDTDRSPHHIEFFNPDTNAHGAGIAQDFACDAVCQSFDQIDMTSPEDDFDRVDDQIVGKNSAHIVKSMFYAPHVDINVEAHILRLRAFEIIGANGAWEHEIMDENPVRLDKPVIGSDHAARQEM